MSQVLGGEGETPLLEVQNIEVEREGTRILQDFSWKVMPGENWIIFGPNGAGKTTLLNVVQAYLWPTSGKVKVFGGTLGDGVDVREMRRRIAVVSETVRSMINPSLSGLECVITGGRAHLNIFDEPSEEERDKAHWLATAMKLDYLLEKPFSVMSTGERQRILVCRALMAKPAIIVLDEPCSGLDLAAREWLLQTIAHAGQPSASDEAAIEGAPSFLFTTHHVEEVLPMFTHALLIRKGKVFGSGETDEMFTSDRFSRLFDMDLVLKPDAGRWSARAAEAKARE